MHDGARPTSARELTGELRRQIYAGASPHSFAEATKQAWELASRERRRAESRGEVKAGEEWRLHVLHEWVVGTNPLTEYRVLGIREP